MKKALMMIGIMGIYSQAFGMAYCFENFINNCAGSFLKRAFAVCWSAKSRKDDQGHFFSKDIDVTIDKVLVIDQECPVFTFSMPMSEDCVGSENLSRWWTDNYYQFSLVESSSSTSRWDILPIQERIDAHYSKDSDSPLVIQPLSQEQTDSQCGFHAAMNMIIIHNYLLGNTKNVEKFRQLYSSIVGNISGSESFVCIDEGNQEGLVCVGAPLSKDLYHHPLFQDWSAEEVDRWISLLAPNLSYFYVAYNNCAGIRKAVFKHLHGRDLPYGIDYIKCILERHKAEGKICVIPLIIREGEHHYSLVIAQDQQGRKAFVLTDSYYPISNREETLVKELADALERLC